MTTARIAPAKPPFPEKVQAMLDRILPEGLPVITLFSTLARDPRLFHHFIGRGLGAGVTLTQRQREVVVDRVTAQCGSEYEWGLHVFSFGATCGFTDEHIKSFVHGDADDPCWTDEDRVLIRLCDALHARCDIDDELWDALSATFTDEQIIEAILVAGYYRTVAYLTNGLRMPLESMAVRFPPP